MKDKNDFWNELIEGEKESRAFRIKEQIYTWLVVLSAGWLLALLLALMLVE